MNLLKVEILCETEKSVQMAELGVTTPIYVDEEWRFGYIDRSKITMFYPTTDQQYIVIHFDNDTATLKMNIDELLDLLA